MAAPAEIDPLLSDVAEAVQAYAAGHEDAALRAAPAPPYVESAGTSRVVKITHNDDDRLFGNPRAIPSTSDVPQALHEV